MEKERQVREWEPMEMKALFKEKAKEKGILITAFLKEFVAEVNVAEGKNIISEATLKRCFKEGSKGPKKEIRLPVYKKIEEDFGYSLFLDFEEVYIENSNAKVPEFCQKKLEEAFEEILQYLEEAYDGQRTLLMKNDYEILIYYLGLYKPCMPNYLSIDLQTFFAKQFKQMRETAVGNGMKILDNVGFGYSEDETEEDCELAEDYIENNIEEHRERILKFMYEFVEFWSENVERLYPKGEGQAKNILLRFEECCEQIE